MTYAYEYRATWLQDYVITAIIATTVNTLRYSISYNFETLSL